MVFDEANRIGHPKTQSQREKELIIEINLLKSQMMKKTHEITELMKQIRKLERTINDLKIVRM